MSQKTSRVVKATEKVSQFIKDNQAVIVIGAVAVLAIVVLWLLLSQPKPQEVMASCQKIVDKPESS